MDTLFVPFAKNKEKNSFASKKLQLCQNFSLHKPCQIMPSLETSILALTKSKKQHALI